MNPRMQRLRAEVASDLQAFRARAEELRHSEPTDPPSCALVAVALHHAYGAVESAFVRLSRVLDATEPVGSDWHQALLTAMAMEIPQVRPALIDDDTRDSLHRLLGFRHFFRHAYAVGLSAARLADVRETTLEAVPLVERDFGRIDDLLAALAAED